MISKITLKGNVRVDGIQRVLDKLVKRKRNGLIKVITGIRRCGKSYLLNTIFYHHLIEMVSTKVTLSALPLTLPTIFL